MEVTNHYNLPDPLYRALADDTYDKGSSDFSATELLDPPQIRFLKNKHWEELETDALSLTHTLDGKLVHSILEDYADPSRYIVERRFYAYVDEWKIGGQVDLIDTKTGTLSDYKRCSPWAVVFGKPEWEQQLNILDYLARKNDIEINSLEIVAWYKGWNSKEALRNESYPNEEIQALPQRRWSEEEQRAFIQARIADHVEADNNGPRSCTSEEQWRKQEQWALMKHGRKSAIRVFDSREELFDWASSDYCNEEGDIAPPFYVDHRPGEPTRCLHYCPVREVCQQYAEENNV